MCEIRARKIENNTNLTRLLVKSIIAIHYTKMSYKYYISYIGRYLYNIHRPNIYALVHVLRDMCRKM